MLPYIPLIASVLAFGAVVALIYVAGQYLAQQGHLQRRLPAAAQTSVRTADDESSRLLHNFIARHFGEGSFGIDPTLRGKLRRELLRAGYFRMDAVNYYLFFRVLLPILLPAGTYLILSLLMSDTPWYLEAVLLCVALTISVVGPDIYIDRRQKRLSQRYRELFPDFLDLLVVCIDAGLSLEAALDRVTGQITKQSRELGLNLLLMASEMRAGRRSVEAIVSLGDRLMIDEAQSLGLVLRQSMELGSDVGDTLRVFSEEMREKRVLRGEEHANKLPVKLTIPLALFIFPVVLIVVVFPIVIRGLRMLAG